MRFFILNRHKKAPIKGLDIFTVVPRVGIEPTLPKVYQFRHPGNSLWSAIIYVCWVAFQRFYWIILDKKNAA